MCCLHLPPRLTFELGLLNWGNFVLYRGETLGAVLATLRLYLFWRCFRDWFLDRCPSHPDCSIREDVCTLIAQSTLPSLSFCAILSVSGAGWWDQRRCVHSRRQTRERRPLAWNPPANLTASLTASGCEQNAAATHGGQLYGRALRLALYVEADAQQPIRAPGHLHAVDTLSLPHRVLAAGAGEHSMSVFYSYACGMPIRERTRVAGAPECRSLPQA